MEAPLNWSDLPDEIIERIFSFLHLKHVTPFLAVPQLQRIALNRYYSRIHIYNDIDSTKHEYQNMTVEEFSDFVLDPRFTNLRISKLVLSFPQTLPPHVVQRIQQATYLEIDWCQPENDIDPHEVPLFENIRHFDLECHSVDWGSMVFPPRMEELNISVDRDYASGHGRVRFPRSLKALSLSGVAWTNSLCDGVPNLEELEVEDPLFFRYPSRLKTLRLWADKLPDLYGLELPSTLTRLFLECSLLGSLAGVVLPLTLRELHLFTSTSLTELGIDLNDGLRVFTIDESSLTSAAMEVITYPRSLRTLSVERSRITTLDFVQRLPSTLVELNMVDNYIGSGEEISLMFSPKFTRVAFPAGLKALNLSNNAKLFTGYDLEQFVFPDGLANINLIGTGLTDIVGVNVRGIELKLDKLAAATLLKTKAEKMRLKLQEIKKRKRLGTKSLDSDPNVVTNGHAP
ncbi:hypothetical protein BABINDRAFT_6611 [Babjeviella inositovora NRRL Y-12698]|uniref:F-box domain-containing protein n=1 Tax=Babjeviella inositovora NRRL Y-12698 TaxID=984486 RepID=A0A1E3QWD7_9ASCO|nr:uncharacterized protein BABINDRAFT_6611 [Babjeviella inositovora NRRL Y-12698]ODQ81993.1 hypothetical protein BABINDRAFT_6611 [Babjeviella inositovora NRRL Y-12698]